MPINLHRKQLPEMDFSAGENFRKNIGLISLQIRRPSRQCQSPRGQNCNSRSRIPPKALPRVPRRFDRHRSVYYRNDGQDTQKQVHPFDSPSKSRSSQSLPCSIVLMSCCSHSTTVYEACDLRWRPLHIPKCPQTNIPGAKPTYTQRNRRIHLCSVRRDSNPQKSLSVGLLNTCYIFLAQRGRNNTCRCIPARSPSRMKGRNIRWSTVNTLVGDSL